METKTNSQSSTLERMKATRSPGAVRTSGLETETEAQTLNASKKFVGLEREYIHFGLEGSCPPLNAEGNQTREEEAAAAM